MNNSKSIGLIVILIITFSFWCELGLKSANAEFTLITGESQITLDSADQISPDIYQYGLNHYAVVWADNRNGNWDIYMYYQNYLGDGIWDVRWDAQITKNAGNNMNPKIYDDTIVYQSDRNGNWDIYMYNLTTKVETQITTNTANQGPCAIYGDIIVWQDWRNMVKPSIYLDTYPGMDIYMFNLTSQTEELLPLPETACFSPAISGDNVVYLAENYYKSPYTGITEYYSQICAYNLSTKSSFVVAAGQWNIVPLSVGIRAMSSPNVDGPIYAWTEHSGDWNVVVKNMTNGITWRSATSDGPYQTDVSGNFVAYQGIISGNWDIHLYDVTDNSPYHAINNAARQENPAISATEYANFIVYQDNRNGNWDIYLTAFWYGMMGGGTRSSMPLTPSYVIDFLEQTKSKIVDTPTSNFTGANSKVKENRKNAMLEQFDSAITTIEAATNTQNLKLRTKYFQSAIDQLNGLINKLDGYSAGRGADMPGSGFTPDWIIVPQYNDQVIRSCRDDLQTILNGIA